MILPDVNLLVYALRRELPEHERYRLWLETTLNGDEPVGQVETMLGAPAAVVPDLPGAGVRALLAQCRAGAYAGKGSSTAVQGGTCRR